MLGSIFANLRLSFKQNFLSALFAALCTTLFLALTLPVTHAWHDYLALGALHFACAYLFLEFLWLPLTWCRSLFQGRTANFFFIAAFSLPLAAGISLLFPGNLLHMLFREITQAHKWRTEIAVTIFHLAFAFFFVASLRQARPAALPSRRQAQAASDTPVQPSLFLNGLGIAFGLYFVIILEWWMINLNNALALPAAATPASRQAQYELAQSDPDAFLALPKLFQPFTASLNRLSALPVAGEQPQARAESTRSPHPARPIPPGEEQPLPQHQNPASTGGDAIALLLPLISVALSGTFILFIGGIVPLRLMSNIVLAVQGREAIYCRRLRQTLIYTAQFFRAIIAQNPLFSISSFIVIVFLIIVPLLIVVGGNRSLLAALLGPDQILFIFTLLAAWLSPLIYAGVHVDRTFGLYFNSKLSNVILSMRGHLVVLGYGDLGQRVVRRELAKMVRPATPRHGRGPRFFRRPAWQRAMRPFTKRLPGLERVVSPELNIEWLSSNLIVVDRNSDNFVFAATNEVLGSYGVVSAWEKPRTAAANRETRRRDRILAPVVQGDATEPFTLARVNLERASFLISVVSQEARIREIFTHAAEIGLRTIICVSRSDQINNLTYKASRHPITLVYPKQHSGLALGQRLITAALKIKAHLPGDREYPRIMVVGLNKSNHFMLETLWHHWPEGDQRKAKVFSEMLRFVVTDEPPRSATFEARAEALPAPASNTSETAPRQPFSALFNRWWHSSYITGFRYLPGGAGPRPLHVSVPTCVMKMDEGSVLERCVHEFRPEIIVINDDDTSKSTMLLMRCVNILGRLKFERGDFRFPLLIVSAAVDEESEKRDLGDVFRYYDALTRLHGDVPGPEYPRHAHYRREPPRRLVGDSIHDGLADAEEIISGVRDNWLRADAFQQREKLNGLPAGAAVELNTCLPNVAGALAELSGRLAGLEFCYAMENPATEFFMRAGRAPSPKILRPSFQYLRQFPLEMPGHGFCLSGYADLQEDDWQDLLREEHMKGMPITARVYAKDEQGAPGPERPAAYGSFLPQLVQLTTGTPASQLNAKTFVEVMHGLDAAGARSGYCPGMTICPIASYQHYIVASNARTLEAWQQRGENGALREAPHYSCTSLGAFAPWQERAALQTPRYARIFCCCRVERNDPGMVALALNALNFRRFARLRRRAGQEENLPEDWVVNLEYFKDTSCQNRRFTLNRLFGVRRSLQDLLQESGATLAEYEARLGKTLPLALMQIMPVGGAEAARRWLEYSSALLQFLQSIAPPGRGFELHWWDQSARRREESEPPSGPDYPIAIQINRKPHAAHGTELQCCEFCGAEDAGMAHRCASRRPWMEDDR